MNDHERPVVGSNTRDDVIGKIIEVASEKLAKAEPPVRHVKFLGFDLKAEINLNTVIAVCSFVGVVATGLLTIFKVLYVPVHDHDEIGSLRTEIGEPGQSNYIPGIVFGLTHRMDHMEKTQRQDHDDTVGELRAIEALIQNNNTDSSKRFDRLDNRIDRLIESDGEDSRRKR